MFSKLKAATLCAALVALLPVGIAAAAPNRVSSINATRFAGNPLITNAQAGTAYMNGSEPKQTPAWMTGALAAYPYIMFFADHAGDQIYVASADSMEGPWTIRPGAPLALSQMPGGTFIDHMASPDVHILDDADEGQGFRMYWHGVYTGTDKQCSGLAHAGTDPLSFTPNVVAGQQWSNTIGRFYFRVWEWRGKYYTMAKFHKVGQGELWTSDTPNGPFRKIKNLVPLLRHCGIVVKGDVAMIYYTQIGDAPEHVEMVTVDLNGDPSTWVASDPVHVLYPDMTYEGSSYPITTSVDGAGKNLRQLRDPSVIEIGGNTYLFYSGNGEDNICGATVTYSWASAPGAAFKATINGGNGDGTYKQGDVVTISARQPPAGQRFNGWTGDTQYLADPSQQKTTLTVPAANVTVAASYTATAAALYKLTVHDGFGEGWYAEGTVVNISPMPAPAGMTFDRWTGNDSDVAYVAAPNTAATTVTMPGAHVSVAAGWWDSQTTVAAFEQQSDSNGALVMEAENEDANVSGSGKTWTPATDLAGYSGAGFMQALPNTGARTMWVHQDGYTGSWDLADCARMDYRVYFRRPGFQFIQVRTNNNAVSADIRFKAGLNGVPISSYDLTVNSSTSWNWAKVDYYVFQAWVYVTHCGVNTFSIWSSDDGARVDKIILATNPDYAASGAGPAESPRILPGALPPVTYALTVNSGTGDGNYAAGSLVNIVADPPPAGQSFDVWTGSTATIDNTAGSSTTLIMPAADIEVTATYSAIPPAAAGAFLEANGFVCVEAEHFTSKSFGVDTFAVCYWDESSSYTGSVGTAMVVTPNTGLNAGDGSTLGCRLDFKIYFQTTGNYLMRIRLPSLLGADNSVNAGGDGAVVSSNIGHTGAEWRWPGGANTLPIATTGLHTFSIWMREDGAVVDRAVLTTDPAYTLAPGDTGPVETPIIPPAPSYELVVVGGSGSGTYTEASVVPIAADTAPVGQIFHQWTGDVGCIANVNSADTTVTMPAADVTVTATYQPVFALTVNSGSGDGLYPEGRIVAISADAPPLGVTFDQWIGDVAHVDEINSANTSVTMPAVNVTVTATYRDVLYSLTVDSGSGDGAYAMGTVVPVVADAPAPGYGFVKWTGDTAAVANANSPGTTVTMPAGAVSIAATYAQLFTLTVNSGSGDGTFAEGATIAISADAPAVGFRFDKWTGDTASVANVNSADTTVTIPGADVIVTATYRAVYPLTVTSGSGDGSYFEGAVVPVVAEPPAANFVFDKWTGDTASVANVNSSSTTVTMPAASVNLAAVYARIYALSINFGTGDGQYRAGVVVPVSADAPVLGKTFDRWTGDTASVANILSSSTTVAMPAADVTITAAYKDILYALTVNTGTGDGAYPMTAVVPISADAPAAGYAFVKWTGDTAAVANVNSASTNVTMPPNAVTVTANYAPVFVLTVNSGSGDGAYFEGTVIPIVADAPAAGYAFDRWTGDTASVANVNSSSAAVTMPASAVVVTAMYRPIYPLTVNSGSGDGSYFQGAVVPISANPPAAGFRFEAWIGDTASVANVNSSSTTVTMPASAVTVTATFVRVYSLTVNSGTGDGLYPQGTVVALVADAPAYGYEFDQWAGNVSTVANVNSSSTTLNMPGSDITVTATYRLISGYFILTVSSGSGGGVYPAGTHVPISANAPPPGQFFRQWTGDTQSVACVADRFASDTSLAMPARNVTLAATFGQPVPICELIVVNGLGDGNYHEGEVVPIAADAPPTGKDFDCWIGATQYVDDTSSSSTTVTMPATYITVAAVYKNRTIFTLTVNSGSGDGMHEQGTVVPIVADPPPAGKLFAEWTGDVSTVADIHAAGTTLTMPSGDATVTATYVDEGQLNLLTVVSGTGDGSYTEGTVVPIAADPAPVGQEFNGWTGDTAYVADVNSPATTVTMPAAAVTVTAAYRAVVIQIGHPSEAGLVLERGGKTAVTWLAPTLNIKAILRVELVNGGDTWLLSEKAQAGKGALRWTVGSWKSATQPVYPDGDGYRIRISTLDGSESTTGEPFSIGTVTSLEILGPATVDENSTAQFTCMAHFNYGAPQDYTARKIKWTTSVKAAKMKLGVLTAGEVLSDTACTITAGYGKSPYYCTGSSNITIRNK